MNNSFSCIDLIFTTQPNLVMESGVHSSLHANCHHQLPHVKFHLNVFYPLPYEPEMWHYKLANSDSIQRSIKGFDWEKTFLNVDVNEKALLFNETILNIICSFIPHEIVTCEDRDQPWMTRFIKKAIKDKNLFYQCFVKNTDFTNNHSNLEVFCSLQNNLTITIETAKQQYFAKIAKKLSNLNISSKTYWSILKCFNQ